MSSTYTIAISTRLRRKIFSDVRVRECFQSLLPVALSGEEITVLSTVFRDDGVILSVRGEDLDPEYLSAIIRHRTSGRIRELYPEFQSMPSLWTKRVFFVSGEYSERVGEEIESFFDGIKKR